MTCASCGAPYHEASGHRFTDTMVICGPCTRHFIKFIKSHTKRKWGGFVFYDYAATSVKPPKDENE